MPITAARPVTCGLHDGPPRLATLARRARCILALLASLALLPPVPAEAQTSVHVTNLGQANSASQSAGLAWYANAFTTGGATSDRYTLNSVVVHVGGGGIAALDVSIHANSSGSPGTKIGSSLTGTTSSGQRTYTASGITLNGGTTYFVRVRRSGSSGNRDIRTTSSDAQSGTTGWSIADVARVTTNSGTSWSNFSTGNSLRFRVNATTVGSTPVDPPAPPPGDSPTVGLSAPTICPADSDCPPTPRNFSGLRVVKEGAALTVTATLSQAIADRTVRIPVDLEPSTDDARASEPADVGRLTRFAIRIAAGSTTGTFTLQTYHDGDDTDEYFWLKLGELPSGVWPSARHTVSVAILDDDPPPPLPAPGNLTARTGPASGDATFSWDAVPGADRYEYHYVPHGSGSCSRAVWGSGFLVSTETTVKIGGLDNGTKYCFRVRSDAPGIPNGNYSFPASVVPRDTGAQLFPVENLRVTHNGTSLFVSWEPPDGATHYDVTYRNHTDGVNARAAWNQTGTSVHIICDSRYPGQNRDCVAGNHGYTVGVRARGASNTFSPWRDRSVSATSTAVPDAVSNISVTHNGTSLTATWTAPAGATHYDVTYWNRDTGVNARAAWNRAGTSITITCDSRYPGQNRDCVASGDTYTVGVRARNAAGVSEWRNSPTASSSSSLSLEPNVPNPFNPSTTIRYGVPEAGEVQLVIYNLRGQKVRTLVQGSMDAGSHSVVWDGRDDFGRQVASGVYIYRLSVADFTQVQRMTLMK